MIKKLYPLGFCPGVTHTLDMIRTLRRTQPTARIVLLGAPVHNRNACERLRQLDGVTIAESLKPCSDSAFLVFSAHGSTAEARKEAAAAGYRPLDAACPFIAFRNAEILKYLDQGYRLIVAGDPAHAETKVLRALCSKPIFYAIGAESLPSLSPTDRYVLAFQSTVSPTRFQQVAAAFKALAPDLVIIPICPECLNRNQNFDKIIFANDDLCFIVGDKTSANTTALYQKASSVLPGRTFLVQDGSELEVLNLPPKVADIYVASGTSAAVEDVDSVVNALNERYKF